MHQYQQQQIETKYQDIQNHNSGDKPVYIYLNTLGVFKIHFLCGELKKKVFENFFKYLFCANHTATTNELNGGILVTHFSDFKWYSKQIHKLQT